MDEKQPHDLHEFMRQVSDEMAAEYRRIYAKAAQDPGTAGDEGEAAWAQVLKEWLPPNYHVETKGRLISAEGDLSPQIDVLILKPAYPKKLLEKKIWLADGVAAAFECKTTLTAKHIAESAERSKKFKNMLRRRDGTPFREMRSPLIYGLLAHSHSWKNQKSTPIQNVQNQLDQSTTLIDHPRDLIDIVCVADLATWSYTAIVRYEASWQPNHQPSLKEVFGGEWGPMTAYSCASSIAANQTTTFQPLGALIGGLTHRMAWNDVSMRDMAGYFTKANLGGNSEGGMRSWPQNVFSEFVRDEIAAGKISTAIPWDEWTMAIS